MVMPLEVKPYTKYIPVFHFHDVQYKAKIYDRCGYEIAEVENEFVANEICGILNHYSDVVEALKWCTKIIEETDKDNYNLEYLKGIIETCDEIYSRPEPSVFEEDED
jgi:hypothetical protein